MAVAGEEYVAVHWPLVVPLVPPPPLYLVKDDDEALAAAALQDREFEWGLPPPPPPESVDVEGEDDPRDRPANSVDPGESEFGCGCVTGGWWCRCRF